MSRPAITLSTLDAARLDKLLTGIPAGQRAALAGLQEEIDRAELLAPEAMPADVVTMNSEVTFQVEGSAQAFTLRLVYPADADGGQHTVSVLAPVGSALLGLREGDQIAWPKPGGGNLAVRIIAITYQPERAGDLLR